MAPLGRCQRPHELGSTGREMPHLGNDQASVVPPRGSSSSPSLPHQSLIWCHCLHVIQDWANMQSHATIRHVFHCTLELTRLMLPTYIQIIPCTLTESLAYIDPLCTPHCQQTAFLCTTEYSCMYTNVDTVPHVHIPQAHSNTHEFTSIFPGLHAARGIHTETYTTTEFTNPRPL